MVRKVRLKQDEAEKGAVAKKQRSPDELIRTVEVEDVETMTDSELEALIDSATGWDMTAKSQAKKVKEAKELLLAHAKANSWKTRVGATGACKIGPSSKTTILATAFVRVLKKLGKIDLVDDLLSVKLGEAKKYVGEVPLEPISEVDTEEYGTVSLKALK
uniref:Uncharacterized protein n=1 Tax=viral metagenome TaxID=1070528 RepID=A0A6M3M035_9ZZZZ